MTLNLDLILFYSINHLPHGYFVDMCVSILHIITSGALLYYLCIVFLFIKRRFTAGFLWFISLVITSSIVTMLKSLVQRPRPFQVLSDAIVGIPLPSSFSFPSGEASTAFATAVFLFFLIKNRTARILIFLFASLIAFERVYMGHHYPSDVIIGGLIGAVVSYLVVRKRNL